MSIQIEKIKLGAETIIHYESFDLDTSTTKTVKLVSKDKPLLALEKAFDDLLEDAILFCGLDSDVWNNGKVGAISLKHTDDGEIGVTISVQCEIGGSVVCVNTPYIRPDCVSAKLEGKIDILIGASTQFIERERAVKQMELLAP